MKRLIGFLLIASVSIGALLYFTVGAKAQGSIYNDIAFARQPNGITKAAPGASVRVCTSAASGSTCSPLASIYSNATLTSAKSNPMTADSNGNYWFYAAPGTYIVQITYAGSTYSQTITVAAASCKSMNNVRCASDYSGATAGAKIQAAFNDLPSTGGTVDASMLEGAQTLGTLSFTTSSKPLFLQLGMGTYSGSITYLQGNFIMQGKGRAGTVLLGSATASSSTGGQGRNEISQMQIQNANGNTTGAVLTFSGSSFAYYNNLRNVFINATAPNGSDKAQYGIQINDNITTSVWDNVQVYGASSHGIYIDASSAAFTYNFNQWKSVASNTNGGWGVYLVGNSSSPFLANELNVDAEGNGLGGIYQKDADGTKFGTIYLENNGCSPYIGVCPTGYGLWIDGTYARGFQIDGGFNVGSGTALKVTANFAMGTVSGHRLGGTTYTLDLQPVNTASSIVFLGVRRDGTNDTAATTTSMLAGVVTFLDRFQGRATNIYGIPGGAAAPVYSFSSSNTSGMDFNSSIGPLFVSAGARGMGVFASGPVIPSSGQLYWANGALADSGAPTLDVGLKRISSGILGVSNGSSGTGALQVPAIRSGSASNTDAAGQLTLSAGSATYNFTGTYSSAPICTATDVTSAAAVKASASTTVLTITGTGTDVVNYICFGRN